MKKFKVYSNEGDHEYNLTLNKKGHKTIYELYTSDNHMWTYKNDLLLKIEDTGNGIKMPSSITEYHEMEYIYIVFTLMNRLNNIFPNFNF